MSPSTTTSAALCADELLAGAARGLVASLGYRLGFFDALDALEAANECELARHSTSEVGATAAWLLSAEACGLLQRRSCGRFSIASPDWRRPGLSARLQMLSMIAGCESQLVRSSMGEENLIHDDYHRYDELNEALSEETLLPMVLEALAADAPVDQALRDGVDVLEIGCGRGALLVELAQRYPKSRFLGIDRRSDPLEVAKPRAAHLGNIRFTRRNAATLAARNRFTLVLCMGGLREQRYPERSLRGIHEAIRPGTWAWIAEEGDADSGSEWNSMLAALLDGPLAGSSAAARRSSNRMAILESIGFEGNRETIRGFEFFRLRKREGAQGLGLETGGPAQ